jgi:ABC-2 type transport system permease protein
MVKEKNIAKRTGAERKRSLLVVLIGVAIVIVVNILLGMFFKRFDLTEDKRFSISQPTKDLLAQLDDRVYIEVFLQGQLPSNFRKLRNETENILKEFDAASSAPIEYYFVDPMQGTPQEQDAAYQTLLSYGLIPAELNVTEANSQIKRTVFPAALVSYKGRKWPVQILDQSYGYQQITEDVINQSTVLLEYKFASAINNLKRPQAPKIVFIKGHGELDDRNLSDIGYTLRNKFYRLEQVNLSQLTNADDILKFLETTDLAIIAKPTKEFSGEDKIKLDQLLMYGGKTMWFVELVHADINDVLRNRMSTALPIDLGFDDILFNYGIRIEQDLVQDLARKEYITVPEFLVTGDTTGVVDMNQVKYGTYPFLFFPLLNGNPNHVITKNIDYVYGRFVNTIDTSIRSEGIKKTVLLSSSELSRSLFTPTRLFFDNLDLEQDPARFNQGPLPTAVLLEGEFNTAFKYILEQQDDPDGILKFKSPPNKMIVVADGDIISNDVYIDDNQEERVAPLGGSNSTGEVYDNKAFILNSIEYLLDDSGIVATKRKEFKIRLLNWNKVFSEKSKWRMINVVIPILLVILFGLAFNLIRWWRFGRAS